MNYTFAQNNFISGELSPLMEGRIDTARYQSGLSICENFLPIRQGGLKRRPGTRYAGNPAAKCILVPLLTASGYYVLEFSNLLVRFWQEAHTLKGAPETLVTPYTLAQLPYLKYAVNNGVLWIVHPSHAPRRIYLSAGTFTIDTPTFTGDVLFNASGEYPSVIAFYQGRLFLGATNDEPNTIWASRTPSTDGTWNDFTDFTLQDAGEVSLTSAILLRESDMYGSAINWFVAMNRFVFGSGRSIWMHDGSIVTPVGFDMSPTLYTGSGYIQAQVLDNLVVYTGIGNKSLYAMAYSTDSGGFVSIDLSKDASHMVDMGIVSFGIMVQPDPIIWVVTADGILKSCTIDLTNGMVAWARHPMGEGAFVESVCTAKGQVDELWLSVLRGSTRTIEYMTIIGLDSISDAFYVDCGIEITQTSSATVTGLSHLEGYDVVALADNAAMPEETVASGQVVFDYAVEHVIIGIPYTSTARLLRASLPANGSSIGKIRRPEKMVIRLYNSLGGDVGDDLAKLSPILNLIPGSYVFGTAPALITEDKVTDIPGYNSIDGRIYIVQDYPLPFNILAVVVKYNVQEV